MVRSVFAIIFVLCAVAHAVQAGQLYDALDTQDNIWILRRSYPRNHACVRAKKVSLTSSDYTFQQSYKDSQGQEKTQILYAKLHEEGNKPYMIVSQTPGSTTGIRYTLEHWESGEKCGILTLTTNGEKRCEMHVWDGYVDGQLRKCDAKYYELCSQVSYQVYDHTCKQEASKDN